MVVATGTGKRKGNGVDILPCGRSKRAQRLPTEDASNSGNACPKWCRDNGSLPARAQQACCCGRVIWAQPNHTLSGGSCCGACVRAGVDECFVAQALACARCTSLRNPRRAVPGRSSCHRCPGLWESWCRCPARARCEGYGHTVSRISPIPFSFFAVAFYDVLYASYFCCTSVVLGSLTIGAAPGHCANDLCPTPRAPLLASFACLAAAPQRKFQFSFLFATCANVGSPEELVVAMAVLLESTAHTLRVLNTYQSCRHHKYIKFSERRRVEEMGSEALSDGKDGSETAGGE